MSVAEVVFLWFAIPGCLALMAESPKPLWLTPIGLLVATYFGMVWLVKVPAVIHASRESRVEAEYQETLKLIDWMPKPRTAVDDVLDALEAERPE